MKKFLIVLAIIFVTMIALAIVLPIIFKDDIKVAIDKELETSVNADVLFDVDNFSLSIFSNFPNLTATMKEFGIINRSPFEGEILFAAEELNVEINLFSLFGDKPSLTGITITRPIINIKVLEDGSANYDIAVSTEEVAEEPEQPAEEFSFGIDHWEVIEGEVVYDDATMPFLLKLEGLNHTGSGDFSLDVFDLKTNTTATSVTVAYDGDTYMEGQTADLDVTITISDNISKYTFKENTGKINDFALEFDGWFFMADDYYDMDITYAAKDNTFKSLLSLVPGMYSKEFEELTAKGNISFAGALKGKYDDNSMPAFNVALEVDNAMFQYPDLPTAIENISMNMKVDNPDGVIENTKIDIQKFHMDMGTNPIDAKILIENLSNYKMDASLKASLNLSELNQMYPIEGLDMRGVFDVDLTASGTYDSTLKTMPVLAGILGLKGGYIKSSEFPIPLEDLHFNSKLNNPSGKMQDFQASISDFTMKMDGKELHANLDFSNLDNYTWKASVKGGIDLEKITAIFPLDGMELKGEVLADVISSGDFASLEGERYDQLPTSGNMTINDFSYKDVTLPYLVTISNAQASLTPSKLALDNYEGTIGRSDISMNGIIANYMGFMFGENELLKGTLAFNAGFLDLNELMPEYEQDSTSTESEESYSAIPVPKNIDFILNSNIKKVRYMDMDLENLSGKIIIKDGIANMDGLKFNALGGAFLIAGKYDTNEPDKPKYDLTLKIDELSIKESFEAFTIVKKFAPVAANIIGNISTDFKINGELGQDLMPKFETINGSGLLKVVQATFGDSEMLNKLSTVTKLDKSDAVSLKNVVMATSIRDGKLAIKPFAVKLGDLPATVGGSTGIDGSIEYTINMDVPASKFGSNLTGLSNTLGLGEVDENTTIPLNIAMGGSYLNPTFNLVSSGAKDQAKDALTQKAKEEGTKVAKDLVESLGDSSKVGGALTNLLGSKKDSAQTDSTKTDLKNEATEKAKSALKNLLRKKKN